MRAYAWGIACGLTFNAVMATLEKNPNTPVLVGIAALGFLVLLATYSK